MRVIVTYSVKYTTEIEVEDSDEVDEKMCDVEVLETEESRYVEDSFEVIDYVVIN